MERMEIMKAVRRMQDYINANLNNPITLCDLAGEAGYSQWHCARIFKEATGKAPFEYIRALRLSKAALRLRDGKNRVIDVAFDFVFDSHEGFTRAFSKQFGISPGKYSNHPEPIRLFLPYPVRVDCLNSQKGGKGMSTENGIKTVFVQVVERPGRKAIVKRGVGATHYFEYCDEVGCDIWGILTSIREAMYEPAGMWLPPGMIRPGTSKYVQGVEVPVDYAGKIPEGFEIMELPACKMMVFQGEPYDDEKFEDAIGELWEVMKKYNPGIYGFEWADEDAPRIQLEPQGYRGYIEARPVREVNKK
ncbi:MAG: AraC family transcriptional regulator [Clostridia bacterium]|nr:AraC family transcriptional regulator [Clostridia bacterium]